MLGESIIGHSQRGAILMFVVSLFTWRCLMPDVQRYLREEEREEYNDMLEIQAGNCPEERWQWREATIRSLERLSACRALLEKYQWVQIDSGFTCLECEVVWHSDKILKHAPDCAIAAQLAEVRGE
jgi:hypothetical protein